MPPKRFPKRQVTCKKPPIARLTLEDIQNNSEASTSAAASPDTTQSNYEDELAWCIYQFKTSLSTKKLSPKQAEEMEKNLNVLENPKEPIVKKRCLMKMKLGDYRQQMETEKRNISLGLHNAKIAAQNVENQGQFMRKSSHSTKATPTNATPSETATSDTFSFNSSDNSFRFNFAPESPK